MRDHYKAQKYKLYSLDMMDHPGGIRRSKRKRRYVQKKARQRIRQETFREILG